MICDIICSYNVNSFSDTGLPTNNNGQLEFPPPRGAAWDLHSFGVVLRETQPTPRWRGVQARACQGELRPALLCGLQHLRKPANSVLWVLPVICSYS